MAGSGTDATSSTSEALQDAFARIEAAVDAGDTDLSALGFWRLVRQVKQEPTLATDWAEQVGRIDRKAFEQRVRPRFPVWFGNSVLAAGVAAGTGAIAVSVWASSPVVAGLALVASAGILSVSVHDLGHWAVGRRHGIRFLSYFLDGPFRIQPGIKTDYATYLRARPESRAAMHAAGAIASKVAPFVSLACWPLSNAPAWAAWATLGIGVVQVVTDVVWSTKKSDWKKVRRERRLAAADRAARE
ncbi:MAG: hypothetical protein M3Q23_14355 [Actinomycetota bacterium]|nr:hypothetical protein [Actinomycetota bacterium]